MKKGISCIVLVITLAGTMTTFVKVHGVSTFTGYVKDKDTNFISGVTLMLADSLFNILGVTTTNSQGYYSLIVTLTGNSPYYLSATPNYRWESDLKIVYSDEPIISHLMV